MATRYFFFMSKRELSNLSDDWLHGGKRKKNDNQCAEVEYNSSCRNATMMWKKMWQQKRERECSEVLEDVISQVATEHKNNTETATNTNATIDDMRSAVDKRIADFYHSSEEVMLRKLASGELGDF